MQHGATDIDDANGPLYTLNKREQRAQPAWRVNAFLQHTSGPKPRPPITSPEERRQRDD